MKLKEIIRGQKKIDMEKSTNTIISVYLTSIGNDKKRHTVRVDPDSDNLTDKLAMIGFEDCTVSDTRYMVLDEKESLLIVVVDLDKHYDNVKYDKWWRK